MSMAISSVSAYLGPCLYLPKNIIFDDLIILFTTSAHRLELLE